MKLKLWHKVAITIIITSSVTLLVTLLLMEHSLKNNFLNYLNNRAQEELKPIITTLSEHYRQENDWETLRNNRRMWRSLLGRTQPDQRRPAYKLNRPSESNHRPPMHRRGKPPKPPLRLTLLDQNKQYIAGKPQHSSTPFYIPIHLDETIIGYLEIEKISKLSNAVEQSFSQQSAQHFVYIGLLSLALSSLSAWLISTYLHRRIKPLTTHAQQLSQGQYQYRTPNGHNDELGQLNNDLNHLAVTLEKNRHARQQWIADISHELRTPLAILHGELEALEDGIRPLNQAAVQSLSSEIERLNKLVNDLYQLSLSDLGALTYQKDWIDPFSCIESVSRHFESRLHEKQLSLRKQCHNGGSTQKPTIYADSERLKQLFTNLLENSIRYTNAEGRIEIHCREQAQQYIIELQDSSPSVAPEQLPHLFERLYRTEESRNRETGGAGLGLAIAKEIMIAHQGNIQASPSPLGGLTITLIFPRT